MGKPEEYQDFETEEEADEEEEAEEEAKAKAEAGAEAGGAQGGADGAPDALPAEAEEDGEGAAAAEGEARAEAEGEEGAKTRKKKRKNWGKKDYHREMVTLASQLYIQVALELARCSRTHLAHTPTLPRTHVQVALTCARHTLDTRLTHARMSRMHLAHVLGAHVWRTSSTRAPTRAPTHATHAAQVSVEAERLFTLSGRRVYNTPKALA